MSETNEQNPDKLQNPHAKALGHLGGLSRSQAKIEAARRNGTRGGYHKHKKPRVKKAKLKNSAPDDGLNDGLNDGLKKDENNSC